MVMMLFKDTVYSNYLLSIPISDNYIGYFFAVGCGSYSICAPLVGFICQKVEKVYLT
jgi:hypothetical protein